MIRYPGSKAKLSRKIVEWYFPYEVRCLDYHEPFAGAAYTYKRIIRNGLPFRSFHLSDKFDWIANYLLALRGDRRCLDGTDLADAIEEAHKRFLPEADHEPEIRAEFERLKPACRAGCPFAYLFLASYSNQQYLYPQRRNTASFHPQFLRGGISVASRAKALEWRALLRRATVSQADAFDVLPSLGSDAFAYVDPPYVTHGKFRLYGCEFERDDHHRLAEILRAAPYKWCLSYGDRPLVRELYRGFDFRWLHRSHQGTRSKHPEHGEWLIRNC